MTNILELLKNEKVEWKKLGEVCENKFWMMPATPKFISQQGIPYITGKNIKQGKIDYSNVKYITEEDFNQISKNRELRIDDVLISMIGTIGEIGIIKESIRFYGQNLYVLRLDKNQIMNKYFYYYFSQDMVKNSLIFQKNNSSQGYIRAGQLESLEIPIPSLEIQEKIVEILDKFTNYVTELQSELQSRIKQYTYYRDKLLSEEYLNKITKEMEEDRRLKIVTLGEIGEFTRGNGLQKKDFKDKGNPVIHYGQIYTKYGFAAERVLAYTSDEIFSKLRKAQKNDILIATTSENIEDVGKSVVWLGDEEIGFSGDMYSYSTQQNSKYIAYCFQTNDFQRQKKKKATGTKMIRIHANDMEKFEIPLPPISLQNKIVKVLDKFQVLLADTRGLLPEEIEKRQKQYEYYREKLLTFDIECSSTHARTHIIIISNTYYESLQEVAKIVDVDIEDKVEHKYLEEICEIISGGDVPKLNISQKKEDIYNIPIISNGIGERSIYGWTNIEKINRPSVTISARGTIGWVNLILEPFYPIVRLLVLTPKTQVNITYIYYLMKNKENFYILPETGIPQLTKPMIKNIMLLIPPLHVQQHVVNVLDKFDTLANDIKEGLPKEIEHRQKQYEYWREQLLSFNL